MAGETERGAFFDRLLARKVWEGYQLIAKGDDFFILITGATGDGKSTLAAQIADELRSLGLIFDLESEFFEPEGFTRAVVSRNQTVLIFDEAITGLMNRRAMSQVNVLLLQAFVQCRSRRNALICCIPTPYLLEWYVMERVHLWIHCYKTRDKHTGVERKGAMCIFPRRHVLRWYEKGKTNKQIVLPNGRIGKAMFTARFPLDREAYEKRKQRAQLAFIEKQKPTKKKEKDTFSLLLKALHDKRGWSDRAISDLLDESGIKSVSGQRIGQIRRGGAILEAGSGGEE